MYTYMSTKRNDPDEEMLNRERREPTLDYFMNEMRNNVTVSGTKPNLIVLCGPPGSGKSTIKTKILELKHINAFVIDPDIIRTKLLETVENKNINYAVLSKIVNKLAEILLNEAIAAKQNIVFDTTGQKFGAIPDLVKRPDVKESYHTIFSVVWASIETCIDRVIARNTDLQRARETDPNVRIELPSEEAGKIYNKFVSHKNGIASDLLLGYKYKTAKSEGSVAPISVNEILLYDNENEPILLFHKIDNQVVLPIVERNGFYNMNITGKSPFISLTPPTMGGKTKKKYKHKKRNTKHRKIDRKRRFCKI
jgi:predicted kinase